MFYIVSTFYLFILVCDDLALVGSPLVCAKECLRNDKKKKKKVLSHTHTQPRTHAVAAKFNELGIKAKIEVRDILADTQRRPGDVALPAGVTGKRRIAVDVTIRTPFAASVLRGAATTIGYTASQGEAAKRGYCEEKCSREGWDFLPFAMEVFGGFGGAAAGLVRRCGRFASRAQSADVVAHIGRTSAHISAAFQRALGAPGDQYVAATRTY